MKIDISEAFDPIGQGFRAFYHADKEAFTVENHVRGYLFDTFDRSVLECERYKCTFGSHELQDHIITGDMSKARSIISRTISLALIDISLELAS